MQLMGMEALRAFVEGGSIAEASLRLRRSASQVSRLLAALEDDVGYALLVKEGRRLTLTEPGRQLYERIGEMLRANDALTDYLRHARRKSRTHVNVLVAQHLIDGLLVDAIAGATREEPDFGASVNARMPPNVDAWISQQHFDIALAQLPVEHPLLVTETLAETHAVAVFGPDDPRADLPGPITPRALGQGRFIGMPAGGSLFHRYLRAFGEAGYQPEAQFEVTFGFFACQLAASGCGAALSDPLAALTQLHRGARLRRFEPAVPLQYGLIYPKSRPPSAAARLLIRHLRRVVGEKLAQAEALLNAAEPDALRYHRPTVAAWGAGQQRKRTLAHDHRTATRRQRQPRGRRVDLLCQWPARPRGAHRPVGAYVRPEHGMLWIGLRNPSPELLGKVVSELGACDKNQEEMLEPHRRPKIIDYGNMVLIVAITVEVEAERPIFGETQFLIGDGFLVTVRRGATAGHSPLRERLEASPDLLKRGSDYVASELLDWLVDRYVAAAAKIESVVEGAEQKLLIRGAKDSDIRRLYRQRRDLLRIHTVVSPLAEICRRGAGRDDGGR